MDSWILGFDVGGTKTAVVAGTPDGRITARVELSSRPERGFDPMFRDMLDAARTICSGRQAPMAAGVSIGGPLDTDRGIIYSPPHLPGWDAVPLRSSLQSELGVPVYVEHDAKACALAEWLFGAAQGEQDAVFLTFGTGFGAGLILGGRLYRGSGDVAGEVGHWRLAGDGPALYGKAGSWEGLSSGAGIAALARLRFPQRFGDGVTAQDVIEAARAGDVSAREVLDESTRVLGHGIALLVDLLNPGVVVLGSLAVRAGDFFLPTVDRILREECLPQAYAACRVVPAALGDHLGDVAAICAALYRMPLPR